MPTLEAQSPIKAAYLDSLLIPDPERELLRWLDGPKGYRERIKGEDSAVWAAFRRICADRYGFDPVDDGEVTAAGLLGSAGVPGRTSGGASPTPQRSTRTCRRSWTAPGRRG